jgi:hypothetical protein
MMLKTKLRMTLVVLMIVAISSALGYVTVQAAHPFVHPTWPEVKAKYWYHAEKNGTATAVFHGECVQPNPTQIKSQTSMRTVRRRCPTVDVMHAATIWAPIEDPTRETVALKVEAWSPPQGSYPLRQLNQSSHKVTVIP